MLDLDCGPPFECLCDLNIIYIYIASRVVLVVKLGVVGDAMVNNEQGKKINI